MVHQHNNYPLILCDQILDFAADYGFLQLIKSHTRNKNTLDIFFTNQPLIVESCEVIPGISNHEIVSVISLTSTSHSKPNPRKIILWHNTDFEAINNFIAQFADAIFGAYDHSTSVNIL